MNDEEKEIGKESRLSTNSKQVSHNDGSQGKKKKKDRGHQNGNTNAITLFDPSEKETFHHPGQNHHGRKKESQETNQRNTSRILIKSCPEKRLMQHHVNTYTQYHKSRDQTGIPV